MQGMKDLIIYGNGAMAKLLYSFSRHRMNVVAFTVDDHCIDAGHTSFCGMPLIPFSQIEQDYPPSAHAMIVAVGYGEMNELRERKYLEAKAKGYGFASYVHESVFMHDGVVIEENCIVFDHVSIHAGSHIGHSTFISSNVNIGHDCRIGHANWINSGVSIAGGCEVGSHGFWGVNACVGHGVQIGKQNFIGANTLISRSTGDGEVYLSEPGMKFKLNSKAFLKFSPALKQ
jgi:sugar O-acyltransferase (sialic acid O-acetyltransferase NeuD family)